MNPAIFDYLSGVLKEQSGLSLTSEKTYLLESRLMPIARKRGLSGLDDIAATLRRNGDRTLLKDVTEAMTTNESFFFRDVKPFEQFRSTNLPYFLEARAAKKSIRIWCAACSTGQEPYSLSIYLKEDAAKLAGWRVEIVATDLSTEVLEKAKVGIYSQFEVQRGLPIQTLMKYFKQVGEMWQIDAALRGMVKYRAFNLLDDLAPLGRFDIVYCRNVLIYFDQATKKQVLENIARLLPDDGILYLGGAETVLGVTDAFKPVPNLRGLYAPVR